MYTIIVNIYLVKHDLNNSLNSTLNFVLPYSWCFALFRSFWSFFAKTTWILTRCFFVLGRSGNQNDLIFSGSASLEANLYCGPNYQINSFAQKFDSCLIIFNSPSIRRFFSFIRDSANKRGPNLKTKSEISKVLLFTPIWYHFHNNGLLILISSEIDIKEKVRSEPDVVAYYYWWVYYMSWTLAYIKSYGATGYFLINWLHFDVIWGLCDWSNLP